MKFFNRSKPIVLCVLDGLGAAPPDPGNAVDFANTPNLDFLWPRYPHGYLYASGTEVGLPFGVPGNSEVCHLNIGAGKIVMNDLSRIDNAIVKGEFDKNPVFENLIKNCIDNGSNLHILSLAGLGYTHSSINHLKSFIKLVLARSELKNDLNNRVFIHAFTDGRDSGPKTSKQALEEIQDACDRFKIGKIASLVGRYYAMDRDDRWERTKVAYDLIIEGQGEHYDNFYEAIDASYASNITDEFITPKIFPEFENIKCNDSVIFLNFRSDRAIQLTESLVLPNFDKFERKHICGQLHLATMTNFYNGLVSNDRVAFHSIEENIPNPLAKVISDAGLKQLHIAESEKFPHVTYFFNGANHEPNPQEDWVEVPSPRDVPTYDYKPQMSAHELTDEVLERINNNTYDFILINFANPDMVGHTGVLKAGIKAIETVDECIGRIYPEVLKLGGTMIITSDHGNVEEMINKVTGDIDTQHSINPVPFIFIKNGENPREIRFGRLADISPTILNLLQIPVPHDMTGRDLLS
ncbi:2,3-bisphosphoglycerate-independent phosphoglycerate mutase [bacterium]|nr:MAG: 2,3-bisphosphoglycerate-independent phosphoglycerate mutase [bacterium]